jgi:hypothetical protein
MTIYIRFSSSSDGGHNGKESDDFELHLDGFVWLCLVLELAGGRWMEKDFELESGCLKKLICL